MQLIRFPLERVIDINEQILKTEAGFKGAPESIEKYWAWPTLDRVGLKFDSKKSLDPQELSI